MSVESALLDTAQDLRQHATLSTCKRDVEAFIVEAFGEEYLPYQKMRDILRSIQSDRKSLVYGVNASSKSFSISGMFVCWWWWKGGTDSKVVMITPSYAQSVVMADRIRSLIAINHQRYADGLTQIYLDGRISGEVQVKQNGFTVVVVRNPERTVARDVIRAAHSDAGTLTICEEGASLAPEVFNACRTICTGANDKFICVSNPNDPDAYAMQQVKLWKDDPDAYKMKARVGTEKGTDAVGSDGWMIHHIGWTDLPAYTGEKVSIQQSENLLQQEFVEDIAMRFGEDSPDWIILVDGEPAYQEKLTLIRQADVAEAYKRNPPTFEDHIPQPVLGVDVALFGSNDTMIYGGWTYDEITEDAEGNVSEPRRTTYVKKVGSIEGNDVEVDGQATYIIGLAVRHDAKMIYFDASGIGAAFKEALIKAAGEQGYAGGILGMIAAGRDIMKHRYANNRAWWWDNARERLHKGEIILEESDTGLRSDLTRLGYKYDSASRMVLQSKSENRKAGAGSGSNSPDSADAAVFCMLTDDDVADLIRMTEKKKPKPKEIHPAASISKGDMFSGLGMDSDPFRDYMPDIDMMFDMMI